MQELTVDDIMKCISNNLTITNDSLRDGVINACLDSVSAFCKVNNLAGTHEHTADCHAHGCIFQSNDGSLPESVCEAYGWLWHDTSGNSNNQKARRRILSAMTPSQAKFGIRMAKENGAFVKKKLF